MQRAYYSATSDNFLKDKHSYILGELCKHHTHDLNDLQKNAWVKQIDLLKQYLGELPQSHIFFEFSIPRMGKRADNILIIDDLIFTIEFKVGDKEYEKYAIEQVIDYSFDLKNFHEGSHERKILPILISTKASSIKNSLDVLQNNVYKPLLCNENNFLDTIKSAFTIKDGITIDPVQWCNSIYKPTPTIVEAAQALYKGHNVQEISRSDSGAINLSKTASCLNRIIDNAKETKRKVICFLTGVPGAGKTLAGLNIATERMKISEDEHAVFLSGNGPLVEVLREALTRDQVLTSSINGISITKKDASRKAHAFIQNIHHFRDEGLMSEKPPTEKVVVFDEAQRAWTKEQASSFMKRKKGKDDFNQSEPDFLIEVMDRHKDWCVIICLIGGGQEINTGEAGLEEWFYSLKNHFGNWDFYYSHLIVSDDNYLKKKETIDFAEDSGKKEFDLHLSVSIRSFRSEQLSNFIEQLLHLEKNNAISIFNDLSPKYPIKITRDLKKAKSYIRKLAVGSERYGVIASSNARRLRPSGIDVKNEISPSNWFLNDKDDIRSSYFLEETATEFDIQGLELDWTIVAWGGDLYFHDGKWHFQSFKGTKWQDIKQDISREYLLNAYRVLLTRARQGMIIYIPEGSAEDLTRKQKFYDGTYNYLVSLGIGVL